MSDAAFQTFSEDQPFVAFADPFAGSFGETSTDGGGLASAAEPSAEDRNEPVPADDPYDAGHAQGRAEAMAETHALDERLSALIASVERLRTPDVAPLVEAMAHCVRQIVRSAIGEGGVDEAMLLTRARACIEMIDAASDDATLRVAAADLPFFESQELPLAIVADASLLPGSVRLDTADGVVVGGSEALMARIDRAIEQAGGAPC